MPAYYVQTFGCRASQADGAALEAALGAGGFGPAGRAAAADVVVLNTCTVTAAADQDARQTIRRIHRENPGARIVVTGCYAQRAPQEIAAIPGVSCVVGNSHKGRLVEEALAFHGQILVGDIREQRDFEWSPASHSLHDRTRPNLKIQDGCNNRCSFCVIPSVRGSSRSAPADLVVAQVRALAARYAEIVLTGINLGQWGRDLPNRPRLAALLRRLLDETPVARLRISSVEPMDWTAELLAFLADEPRMARHVHAPLQSGSDTILRRMHRRYRARDYEARILAARRLLPEAAIGADVLAGFPGETDADFDETRRLVAELPFTYLHVFSYSARPGTAAAARRDQVPPPVRRERNRLLRELAAAKNLAFRRSLLGRPLSAVTLDEAHPSGTVALTDNYLKVLIPGAPLAPNQIVDRTAAAIHGDFLVAAPTASAPAPCCGEAARTPPGWLGSCAGCPPPPAA